MHVLDCIHLYFTGRSLEFFQVFAVRETRERIRVSSLVVFIYLASELRRRKCMYSVSVLLSYQLPRVKPPRQRPISCSRAGWLEWRRRAEEGNLNILAPDLVSGLRALGRAQIIYCLTSNLLRLENVVI